MYLSDIFTCTHVYTHIHLPVCMEVVLEYFVITKTLIVKYKSIIYPFTVIEDHSITETWGIILMWDVVLKILNCYLNKSKILNCMCSMNQFLGETHMKLLPIGCNCGQAQCEWGLWFFTPGQTGPQVACPLLLSHAPLSLLTGFLVWHLHRHRSLLVVCSPSL